MNKEGKFLDALAILSKVKISEGGKIADLGCGSHGHFVFPAAKLTGNKGRVYAVDIQKTVLESISRRAKLENCKCVKAVWSNLELFNATKIEAGKLDIAMLINTMYQSHKRVEILREAIRIIKKGGRLLIVEWIKSALPFGPPVEERVDKDILKIAAPKLGLELEEEFKAGEYHYGLVFNKL